MKIKAARALVMASLAIPPGAAFLCSTPAQASTAKAPEGVRFMSTEEYVSIVGADRARANGITLTETAPPTTRLQDPTHHWYTIVTATRDANGRDIPLRYGYSDAEFGGSGGGWAHACHDHNLCAPHIIARTFNEHPESQKGPTRFNYSGVAFDQSGRIYEKVISSQDQGHTGFYEPTPDGRPFGLVTAYCQGKTTCPDWINSLP